MPARQAERPLRALHPVPAWQAEGNCAACFSSVDYVELSTLDASAVYVNPYGCALGGDGEVTHRHVRAAELERALGATRSDTRAAKRPTPEPAGARRKLSEHDYDYDYDYDYDHCAACFCRPHGKREDHCAFYVI